jgi:hypothetical protein
MAEEVREYSGEEAIAESMRDAAYFKTTEFVGGLVFSSGAASRP